MRRPKLDKIKGKLLLGNDFVLSREQYIKLTGTDIPQSKSYTENKSAVAKISKEYGYVITVVPEKLVFCKSDNG